MKKITRKYKINDKSLETWILVFELGPAKHGQINYVY